MFPQSICSGLNDIKRVAAKRPAETKKYGLGDCKSFPLNQVILPKVTQMKKFPLEKEVNLFCASSLVVKESLDMKAPVGNIMPATDVRKFFFIFVFRVILAKTNNANISNPKKMTIQIFKQEASNAYVTTLTKNEKDYTRMNIGCILT